MKWYEKIKNQQWFHITVALCSAVLLYFILQHLGTIWNIITGIWSVLIQLVVATFIAYIIDPLVRLWERTIFKKLKRRNHARYFSIAISLALIVLFLAALFYILIPQLIDSIRTLIENVSGYMLNLETWLSTIGGGMFREAVKGFNFDNLGTELVKILSDIAEGEDLISASVSVGSGVANAVVSCVLAVFFLGAKERMLAGTRRLCKFVLKEKRYEPFARFCSNCNKILVKYICCSLLEAVGVGLANAGLMAIFGLPYISIISLAVGVTNLVPTFGPIAGGVIGGFILVLVNPWYMVIFVAITIGLQFIDGYIVKPKLFSGQLGVSSLLILISIIVLGKIFGFWGVLFAIPIAAILQYLYRVFRKWYESRPEYEEKK